MNKKVITLVSVLVLLLLIGIIVQIDINGTQMEKDNSQPKNDRKINDDTNEGNKEKNGYQLSLYEINGQLMISLAEIGNKYNFSWNYDPIEGTLEIKDLSHEYSLLEGTTVISKNGVYVPNTFEPYFDLANVYIPLGMLKFFDLSYQSTDDENVVFVFAMDKTDFENNSILAEFEKNFAKMNEDDLISYLSFLSVPLDGAHITTKDSQLPGAPRAYRNGTHEGIDWYDGYIGIHVDRNTPVLSMAEGVIVRADHNYQELNFEEREQMLNHAADLNHTPLKILDKLRGRSVWVQYSKGVLVRYAHLSIVEDSIKVGKTVKTGEVLGYVGNSGTSYGVEDNNVGLHLHSDILIYDHLFWDHLDQKQLRYVLEKLFP